jgi:cysteine desulfurase
MESRIYLDHAATTPLDARVLEAMLPCLTQSWANPSSVYAEAREARLRLTTARRSVAEVLGAKPAEIVFTSGGSESDNLALRGISHAAREWGNHVVTVTTEHHAVLNAAAALEKEGFHVTRVPVDEEGFVDAAVLEAAIEPETSLVSVMLANNETGTIQPIAQLSELVRRRNPRTIFHTDAVQAAGMVPIDVDELGVHALSLAAHKFYGPKGAGVLYLRTGTPLDAQIAGGTQEKERRAGTENVAGAVGLAAALRLATDELQHRISRARLLRDRLLREIPRRVRGTLVTGPADGGRRLANNASFCFEGVDAEMLLMQLDLAGVAASSGSACTSGSLEPSHVLTAMGISSELARGSLRLTLGTGNTGEEIDTLLALLPGLIDRQRVAATAAGGFADPVLS